MSPDIDGTDVVCQPPTPPPTVTRSPTSIVTAACLGKKRSFYDLSCLDWMFLSVSLSNLVGTMSFAIYRLIMVSEHTASADFTLSILILVNACFCLYYVFSSLLFEMKPEVFVYVVAIVIVVIYCSIDYGVNAKRRDEIKRFRLGAVCVLGAINISLAIPVAVRFRWLEFRIVGPSEMLQAMYRHALWFICLLILDWQLSYSVVVLSVQDVADFKEHVLELLVLCVGFFVCPLWSLLGWCTVRHESVNMALVLGLSGLLTPTYAIFKLVKRSMALAARDSIPTTPASLPTQYTPVRTAEQLIPDEKTLDAVTIVTCMLYLIVRVILYFGLVRITLNFGKGLKEKTNKPEEVRVVLPLAADDEALSGYEYNAGTHQPNQDARYHRLN